MAAARGAIYIMIWQLCSHIDWRRAWDPRRSTVVRDGKMSSDEMRTAGECPTQARGFLDGRPTNPARRVGTCERPALACEL